jgi:hypothetical protein
LEEEGGRDAGGREVEPKEEVALFAANNSGGSEMDPSKLKASLTDLDAVLRKS